MKRAYVITVVTDTDLEDAVLAAADRISADTGATVVVERETRVGPFYTSRFITSYDLLPA